MSEAMEHFGQEVSSALGDGPAPERLTRQRARLIASTEERPHSLRHRTRVIIPAIAASVTLAVVAVVWWSHAAFRADREELQCRVGDRPVAEGQWLTARDGADLRLRFSDGSEVTVEPRALARLVRLERDSVHFLIEGGTVGSDITPGMGVEWTFLAGPYRVVVIGTRLRVDWNLEERQLTVSVTEGRVRVLGAPLGDEGLLVVQGHVLRARDRSVLITQADGDALTTTDVMNQAPEDDAADRGREPAASVDDAPPHPTGTESDDLQSPTPSGSDPIVPAHPTGSGALGNSEARVGPPIPSHLVPADEEPEPDVSAAEAEPEPLEEGRETTWLQLAAAGRYSEAMAAADQEGFERLLDELSPWDLLRLADVARLDSDTVRARQALLALRERHGGSRPAQLAAFRLGRLAYESSHDFGQAAHWFRVVIRESPSGPHTADARGRLMEALVRQGRTAEAVEAARDYLHRHPGGSYAAAARTVIEQQEPE